MFKPLLKQKLFFFCLDCLFVLLAFVGAFYMRFGRFDRPDFPFGVYVENALLIIPIWLLILVWGERYSVSEKSWSEMIRIISIAALAGTVSFVLTFFFRIIFFERGTSFSRGLVLLIFILGSLLGMFGFWLEQVFAKWKVQQSKDIVRTLIIGNNRAAVEMIAALQKKYSRYQPVAILAPFGGQRKEIHGIPVMGKLDALERVVEQEDIHALFLCDGVEQMLNLLSFAEGRFLEFRISPEILGVFRENIFPELISGKTLLALKSSPLLGWGQLWKRSFDIICSLILIIFLMPIWAVRKILSGLQPVFEREKRIGAGGREFAMFRSKSRNPKFFLRDLPNVLNILHGEMSFVGPRPALPQEWAELPAHFKRRMILRPGMLGAWQLQKLHGEKDNFERMCQEDLNYIHHWSFSGDMWILVLSVWKMLKKVGSWESGARNRELEVRSSESRK